MTTLLSFQVESPIHMTNEDGSLPWPNRRDIFRYNILGVAPIRSSQTSTDIDPIKTILRA